MALDLTPYALVSVARLEAHLTRSSIGETDVSDRCISAINAATSWMELRTRRALAARNWRTAFTVNLSSVVDAVFDPFLLDVSTPLLIKRGDDLIDMVNGYVPIGSKVSAYDEDSPGSTQVRITVGTTAALSASPVTFGSIPLACNGDATNALDAPEWPIQALWGAYAVDSDGTRTALNIASARIHRESGRIVLPYDVFPAGELNIELECRAGYEQPSTTVQGDWSDWSALERIALRAAECFFVDDLNGRGRQSDVTLSGMSARLDTFAMPADVESSIQRYVRTR